MHTHSHIKNGKASLPIYELFSVILRYPYYMYIFFHVKQIGSIKEDMFYVVIFTKSNYLGLYLLSTYRASPTNTVFLWFKEINIALLQVIGTIAK